jgi:uncharacterized protein YbjT (DUF2867 family)
MMILIVGATGSLGSEICRKLAGRGEKVRALVRTTSAPEKVDALRALGAEIAIGDLKDSGSIAAAVKGVDAVVSTASATISRSEGDSIESVDGDGQMTLVKAAKAAHVTRFLFVSFRHSPAFPFPLSVAKTDVEEALKEMTYTIVQGSFFMESWLAPHTGFDYINGKAIIYGDGKSLISWVAVEDVAEMCVKALLSSAAENRTIEFGGPEALSMLEAVERFERVGGRKFELQFVPTEMLMQQFQTAPDSISKTYAALGLGAAHGDAMNTAPVIREFGLKPATVEDYARRVLQA